MASQADSLELLDLEPGYAQASQHDALFEAAFDPFSHTVDENFDLASHHDAVGDQQDLSFLDSCDFGSSAQQSPLPASDRPPQSPSRVLQDQDIQEIGPDTPSAFPRLPPKIGNRFSKDSLRVLKTWLTAHSHCPFPSDDERQHLELRTGLTKTQILNWLANARRRGKVRQGYNSTSRAHAVATVPVDIPQRPGTPAPRNSPLSLSPLERWMDSPPEHEPATAKAIERAMELSLAAERPSDSFGASRGGSGASSLRQSPASSIGTSHSSDGSAFSFSSRNSSTLVSKSHKPRSLRKQRAFNKLRGGDKTPLSTPLNTYQCTFCTETFSTKHIWQRHENSLHLALERWVCAPWGPHETVEEGVQACAFCGELNPDDEHIEAHYYSTCQERTLEDRTFHRKDHLGQHLRLVHNVDHANLERLLRRWKMETPEIRSVCGFCGITMYTWEARTDHLAEHFKLGKTMADWTGDWGFDPPILDRLENSIAPYMITYDRNSPYPFAASTSSSGSPRNAYELIRIELMHYIESYHDSYGKLPSSAELHHDACRIIFAAEVSCYGDEPCNSWLRDLIMSNESVVQKARLSPLRSRRENKLAILRIVGKCHPFMACPLEADLLTLAQSNHQVAPSDEDLQRKAALVISEMEKNSAIPADLVATWLVELARSSTTWLNGFKQRACISSPLPAAHIGRRRTDNSKIDSIIENYNVLEARLADYLDILRTHGMQPDEVIVRQKAMSLIDEFDDEEWRQTAKKNDRWLARFLRRHLPWSSIYSPPGPHGEASTMAVAGGDLGSAETWANERGREHPHSRAEVLANPTSTCNVLSLGVYFLNDPNVDSWMARELARWVAATMSPHNPNQHVPTDEELQHQARWMLYGDDDPFNQTGADVPEWLTRFKRQVGILEDFGPGLPGLEQYYPQ
ncbi:unnamed protein product [Clonostachys rhizophaga]|uniref:Monocarboxylate transporter 4 n=1 Tax=Clonostachys rhizophaga TaxID=160324 RepID=A0A9N9VMK9_9HYPO|nr:unnamed protein product [Clonostachys rhizophaga]